MYMSRPEYLQKGPQETRYGDCLWEGDFSSFAIEYYLNSYHVHRFIVIFNLYEIDRQTFKM